MIASLFTNNISAISLIQIRAIRDQKSYASCHQSQMQKNKIFIFLYFSCNLGRIKNEKNIKKSEFSFALRWFFSPKKLKNKIDNTLSDNKPLTNHPNSKFEILPLQGNVIYLDDSFLKKNQHFFNKTHKWKTKDLLNGPKSVICDI